MKNNKKHCDCLLYLDVDESLNGEWFWYFCERCGRVGDLKKTIKKAYENFVEKFGFK